MLVKVNRFFPNFFHLPKTRELLPCHCVCVCVCLIFVWVVVDSVTSCGCFGWVCVLACVRPQAGGKEVRVSIVLGSLWGSRMELPSHLTHSHTNRLDSSLLLVKLDPRCMEAILGVCFILEVKPHFHWELDGVCMRTPPGMCILPPMTRLDPASGTRRSRNSSELCRLSHRCFTNSPDVEPLRGFFARGSQRVGQWRFGIGCAEMRDFICALASSCVWCMWVHVCFGPAGQI